MAIPGRFNLLRNHFLGFDEPGSSVLALGLDRRGQPPANRYQGSVFERCSAVVREGDRALWQAAATEGNLLIDTAQP